MSAPTAHHLPCSTVVIPELLAACSGQLVKGIAEKNLELHFETLRQEEEEERERQQAALLGQRQGREGKGFVGAGREAVEESDADVSVQDVVAAVAAALGVAATTQQLGQGSAGQASASALAPTPPMVSALASAPAPASAQQDPQAELKPSVHNGSLEEERAQQQASHFWASYLQPGTAVQLLQAYLTLGYQPGGARAGVSKTNVGKESMAVGQFKWYGIKGADDELTGSIDMLHLLITSTLFRPQVLRIQDCIPASQQHLRRTI